MHLFSQCTNCYKIVKILISNHDNSNLDTETCCEGAKEFEEGDFYQITCLRTPSLFGISDMNCNTCMEW